LRVRAHFLASCAPPPSFFPHRSTHTLHAPSPPPSPARQPASRLAASRALQALLRNCGEEAGFEALFSHAGALAHRNWRVREGALALFARAAEARGARGEGAAAAALGAALLLPAAAALLSDGKEDLRRAAVEAIAALAWCCGGAFAGSHAAAACASAGARPAQLRAVEARVGELEGGGGAAGADGDGGGGVGGGGSSDSGVSPPPAPPPAAGIDGSGRGGGGVGGGGGGAARPAAAAAAGQWADHPLLSSLAGLNSGPWWEPGVVGELGDEVGLCQPNGGSGGVVALQPAPPLGGLKELGKFVDGFAATCATTSTDWRSRIAALERLRAYLAGGAAGVEGFVALLPRLRDALCAQVQDLRSSIVRLACAAVGELFAALAGGGGGEALADALVETLVKLNAVSISIIAQSANSCVYTILHNTRAGWARVVPKLCAAARSRSPVLRARAAEYLLYVLRHWAPSTLERHAEELGAALGALVGDADPGARAAARAAYWSFAALAPARAEAVLGRADASAARLIAEGEASARDAALAAVEAGATRVPTLPPPASAAPAGGSGSSSSGGAGSGARPPTRPASAAIPRPGTAPAAGRGGGRSVGAASSSAAASAPAVAGGGSFVDPFVHAVLQPPAAAAAAAAAAAPRAPLVATAAAAGPRYHHVSAAAPPPAVPPAAGAAVAADDEGGSGWADAPPAPPPPPVPLDTDAVAAETALSACVAALEGAATSSGIGGGKTRPLLSALLHLLLNARAVDPRVAVRAFGPRAAGYPVAPSLPAELFAALPAAAVAEALAGMAACTHVSYPPLHSGLSRAGAAAVLRLLFRGDAPLPRVLAAAAASPHEHTVADAHAVLAALADTHVSLSSLVALVGGDAAGSVLGPAAGAALMGGGRGVRLPAEAPSPPVLLGLAGDGSGAGGTVVPLYVYALLVGGGGGGGGGEPVVGAGGATVSPPFRALFASVLHATVGGADVARVAGRRALAALRRALPVPTLIATTLSNLTTEPRPALQTVCLHLLRDLLGDVRAAPHFPLPFFSPRAQLNNKTARPPPPPPLCRRKAWPGLRRLSARAGGC
jgi:hypothetical protein